MPSVFPRSSTPCSDFFSHLPACMLPLAAGICRASASIRPIVSSATAIAFAPGVFITTMPRRVAASASMLSTPTPARPITRSFGACSISASSTCTADRTTSASASASASVSLPGSLATSSAVNTFHASEASTANVAGETFSANTTFIEGPLLSGALLYSSNRKWFCSQNRSNIRTTEACGLPSPCSYFQIEFGCTPSFSAISYWKRLSCFRATINFSPNVNSAIDSSLVLLNCAPSRPATTQPRRPCIRPRRPNLRIGSLETAL